MACHAAHWMLYKPAEQGWEWHVWVLLCAELVCLQVPGSALLVVDAAALHLLSICSAVPRSCGLLLAAPPASIAPLLVCWPLQRRE